MGNGVRGTPAKAGGYSPGISVQKFGLAPTLCICARSGRVAPKEAFRRSAAERIGMARIPLLLAGPMRRLLSPMKYVFLLAAAAFLQCCSGKSDVTLYQEGRNAEDSGNFQLAVDRYEEIINRFQQSAYAESSLYRAGLIYNNDLHDVQKSIASYRKFCTLYPKSKEAPTALFLCGFLFNNELHQLDSAKHVYESFLQKYPSHELAASARFELETLGKEPGSQLSPDTTSLTSKNSSEPSGATTK